MPNTHGILVPQPGSKSAPCSGSAESEGPPGKFPSTLGVLITLSSSCPFIEVGTSLPFYESWLQGASPTLTGSFQPCPHLCKHRLWHLNYSPSVGAEMVVGERVRFLPFLHTHNLCQSVFYFCENSRSISPLSLCTLDSLHLSHPVLQLLLLCSLPHAHGVSVPLTVMLWGDHVRPIPPTCHFCFWVCPLHHTVRADLCLIICVGSSTGNQLKKNVEWRNECMSE